MIFYFFEFCLLYGKSCSRIIYIVFVNGIHLTIYYYNYYFTIYSHFLCPIQLCSHILPLYCYWQMHFKYITFLYIIGQEYIIYILGCTTAFSIAGEAAIAWCVALPWDFPNNALRLEHSLTWWPGAKLLLGLRFFFLMRRNFSSDYTVNFLVLLKCVHHIAPGTLP